jgi:YgiT-type zinc finger domain-containing protein
MKCHVCGTQMKPVVADLPFRVDRSVMIILRELPLLECGGCSAYALQDIVIERVHEMIQSLTSPAHLDVIRYAA